MDPFKIRDKVCDYASGANPNTTMQHNIFVSNPNWGVTIYLYWDENGSKNSKIFDEEEGQFTIYGINLRYKVGPNELGKDEYYNITMAVFDAQDYVFNSTFTNEVKTTKPLRYYQISYAAAFLGGCVFFVFVLSLLICLWWCLEKSNMPHEPVDLKTMG